MTGEHAVRRKRRPELPERIVTVAVGLFDAKGYAGTSMEEIATGVGLTAGALYQHFRDKQAILDVVLDTAAERQRQTLEEGDEGPDACRRLVGLVERLVGFAAVEAALLSVAHHDRHLAGERAQARAREADDAVAGRWLEALLACRPRRSPVEARLVVQALLGAAYAPTHTVSPLPPDRRAALLSAGIVAALLGDAVRPAGARSARGRRRHRR
jgi:AcrR family transcriptional regulator